MKDEKSCKNCEHYEACMHLIIPEHEELRFCGKHFKEKIFCGAVVEPSQYESPLRTVGDAGPYKQNEAGNEECKMGTTPQLRQEQAPALQTKGGKTAKADSGKPKVSLVPVEIIRAIARVREFGVRKYKDPDNWKQVEVERYRDAAFRHMLSYIEEPHGMDEESGLPHLWHLATNVAFLCELEKNE